MFHVEADGIEPPSRHYGQYRALIHSRPRSLYQVAGPKLRMLPLQHTPYWLSLLWKIGSISTYKVATGLRFQLDTPDSPKAPPAKPAALKRMLGKFLTAKRIMVGGSLPLWETGRSTRLRTWTTWTPHTHQAQLLRSSCKSLNLRLREDIGKAIWKKVELELAFDCCSCNAFSQCLTDRSAAWSGLKRASIPKECYYEAPDLTQNFLAFASLLH